MNNYSVVPYNSSFAQDVAIIEQLSFSAPWSEASLTLLTQGQNGGFAAVLGERAVGYVGFLSVLDELEITNVAVHPDHRRQGIGDALIDALIKHAQSIEAVRITLEVRVSNVPAIALYEKFGFVPCGTRKNFYSNPREDAVIMELFL